MQLVRAILDSPPALVRNDDVIAKGDYASLDE
ncbi:hypothetical protein A359_02370 [secondary endosymbiont of Ctenarytaina eucalypti]|uniref:Uncharacterized protein n=1 Tax=secondary endosymbiont of Ctenarytaina eucalypti TaxID=1199245 RepID=J3YRG0_9ENTR|nr:hypothetical protein A359_02370 [secondary endosymbiont of Ctenarytaina eucalypti]